MSSFSGSFTAVSQKSGSLYIRPQDKAAYSLTVGGGDSFIGRIVFQQSLNGQSWSTVAEFIGTASSPLTGTVVDTEFQNKTALPVSLRFFCDQFSTSPASDAISYALADAAGPVYQVRFLNNAIVNQNDDELIRFTDAGVEIDGDLTVGGSISFSSLTVNGPFTVTGTVSASSTVTGTAFIPTGATVPANGIYLAAANTVGVAANTTAVVRFLSSSGPNTVFQITTGQTAFLYNALADGLTNISGGSASTNGANFRLFGGSHASQANDFELRSGSTVRLGWDASANLLSSFVPFTVNGDGSNAGFRVSSGNAVTLGASASTAALTINAGNILATISGNSSSPWLDITTASNTAANAVRLQNTATNGSVVQYMEVPAGNGDPAIHFRIAATQSFSVGIDNSSSDTFKISGSSGPGTNDYFQISTAGAITLGASGGTQEHTLNGILKTSLPAVIGSTAAYSDDRRMLIVTGTPGGTNGTTHMGVRNTVVFGSNGTAVNYGYFGGATTTNASYTVSYFSQFYADNTAKGASSTITSRLGYGGVVPTDGTNNAFLADNGTFTGNWFINSTSTNPSLLSGYLQIQNQADPGAVTNGIRIGSQDTVDATATLSLRTEQAVEAIGTFTASNKLKIIVNNVAYWIQLDAV